MVSRNGVSRYGLLSLSIALVMWCATTGAGTFTQQNWSGGATGNTATNAANQNGWREFSSATSGLFTAGVSGSLPANTVNNGNGTWTTTLQPATTAGIDAYVGDSSDANTNFGGAADLYAGYRVSTLSGNRIFRTFINFDLSGLPIHQIVSADLVLTAHTIWAPATLLVSTVTPSWNAGTVTFANQPAVVATSVTVGPIAATGPVTFSIPLSSGTWPVNGIRLSSTDEGVNGAVFFRSANYTTTPSERPKLIITYNTDPVKIQAATTSTTLLQTSDDGVTDSVNAGGFNAGTTTGGVAVLGDGAPAQLAVPAPATITARGGFGDGHNGVTPTSWPFLKDPVTGLGDGSDAISTTNWPLLNNQGDGSDGAVIFSSGTVDLSVVSSDSLGIPGNTDGNPGQPDGFTTALTATATSGATSLTVGSTAGFVVGDQVMVLQIQHAFEVGRGDPATSSSYCTSCGDDAVYTKSGTYEFRDAGNAGKYEFVKVIGIPGATTLTIENIVGPNFSLGLINNYYATGLGKAEVIRVPQYTSVTINAGVTLTSSAYSSTTGKGGVLVFKANGIVTANGAIDMNGKGYAGGVGGGLNNFQGETYTGYRMDNYRSLPVLGTVANAGGGGYGFQPGAIQGWAPNGASGGGGHGTAGSDSAIVIGPAAKGGSVYGSSNLTTILPGSGGGFTGASGSNGGGIIFITGSNVTLGGSGIIRADGISAGSGGAGGSIYIGTVSGTTTGGTGNQITANGGVATGSNGSGGQGRIYVEGSLSVGASPVAELGSNAKINGYPTGVINKYAAIGTADISAGATSITVATSEATGFAAGDEVMIIQMQHPSNAGRYEFKRLNSSGGVTNNGNGTTTFTFSDAGGLLHRYYGSASNGRAQVVWVPNYTDFAVGGGTAITIPDYDPATGKGGIIAFKATGTVTVDGKIDAFGRGFPGGQIYLDSHGDMHVTQGWSYNGATPTESPFNNAGGGGVRTLTVGSTGGSPGTFGGGGSYATAGTSPNAIDKDASAGTTYGEADLSLFMPGSGGGGTMTGWAGGQIGTGSGGSGSPFVGGYRPGIGGYGGGAVFITSGTLTVNSAGLVTAAGGVADSTYAEWTANNSVYLNSRRQGGAGSGGSIYLGANTLDIDPQRVNAVGGGSINGTDVARFDDVITGGNGRIYVEGTITVPETAATIATPAATAASVSTARLFAWPNGVINKYAVYINSPTTTSVRIATSEATGFANGDEILIILMQHATNAGVYEFRKLDNTSGVVNNGDNTTTLNFVGSGALVNNYSGGKAQVVMVPNYTGLIVADGEGIGLVAVPYNATTGTGGIIAFRANGTVTVRGSIDAAGKGFAGGAAQTNNAGFQGLSILGTAATQSASANAGAAGGGIRGSFAERQGGGGGGGHATKGTNGQGWTDSAIGGTQDQKGLAGGIYGDAVLASMMIGSGGGSGSAYTGDTSGAGGAGGGLIFMTANTIALAAKGNISAKGIDGGHPTTSNTSVGGGGGGAGGSIFLATSTVSQWVGTISATGGTGGGFTTTRLDTSPNVWLGGDGGKGRVRVEVPGGSLPADISSAGVVSIADATTTTTLLSGTFTSAVILAGSATDYNAISWLPAAPPSGKIVTVRVRAGNNNAVFDGTWTAWTAVTQGQNLGTTFDGKTYIQYEVTINGSGGSATAATTFDELSIAYSRSNFAPGSYTIVSSPFNTQAPFNNITSLTWSGSTPTGTSIKFQIHTSTDGTAWGPWYGTPVVVGNPDGLNTYFTASGQAIPISLQNSLDGQYFQYRVILENTLPTVTPTLSTVSVGYIPGLPTMSVAATTPTAFENGSGGVFTITKTGSATGSITVNYTVSGTATAGSDYTALSGSVVFLATDVTKTINVTPLNDVLGEGNETVIVTLTSDPAFNIGTSNDTVTITDDEAAGITVTPTSSLATTEAGGTAQFTVVLVSQPAVNVAVGLSTNDTTEGAATPPSLTFTTANWSTPQTVTVTGVNDTLADGNVAYTIITAPAVSIGGGAYNGLDAADVTVINVDNDSATISVTPVSGLHTTESGGQTTFNVSINGTPTGNVTINLTSNDTTEGTVSSSSLTFTPANAAFPQTVTVTGQSDALSDGSVAYKVVTAASSSTDSNYNNFNAPDVDLVNLDSNPGISVITDQSASVNWPFTNARDYTVSDANYAEVSAGSARLKTVQNVSTPYTQTSDNGVGDTPPSGGFSAGTFSPGVSVTGTGAAASVVKAITSGPSASSFNADYGSIASLLVTLSTGLQTSFNMAWNNATGSHAKLGGQALSFDGNDDYVQLNTTGDVAGANGATGAVSLWVQYRGGTSSTRSPWTWRTNSTTSMYVYVNSTLQLVYCFDSSASAAVCANSLVSVSDLAWHHVVATWGDGGNIRIYVDGALRNSAPATGTVTVAGGIMYLGRNPGGTYFPGFVDELAMYSAPLNLTQVQYLYNSGTGREIASTDGTAGTGAGLYALWHLNNGAPTTVQPFVSPVMNMGNPSTDIASVSWLPVSQTGGAALQVEMRKGSTPAPLTGRNPGTLNVGSAGQTTATAAWNATQAILTPVDGQGLHFDGIDDAVTVGTTNRPVNNFTVELWAKLTSGTQTVISAPSTSGTAGATGQRYVFGPEQNAGTGDSNNAGMGISFGGSGVYVIESATGYMPAVAVYGGGTGNGQWLHIAVVYTNKTPQIYINGSPAGTSVTSPKTNVYAPINIGGIASGRFNGAVDQVAIWNYSLTPAQIASHYTNAGSSTNLFINPKLTGTETGLVGLWHFNEGTGTSIADSSDPNGLGNSSWSGWVPLVNGGDTNTTLDGTQYLQYRALLTNSATNAARLDSLTVNAATGAGFYTGIVTVQNKTGIPSQQVLSFVDTLGPNHTGTVKYQLSNNGTNWYYHNGTSWVSAASPVLASANTGGEVAARIGSFASDVGTGMFYYRALLNSPTGVEAVELDKIAVGFTGSTLLTSESGLTGNFKIVLNTAPTANVTLGLTSANTNEGTPSTSAATFTPANWSTAQTVTVNPQNDNIDDGDITYNIVTGAATSTDGTYSGMAVADVPVTNLDDDTAGITVTPTSGLQTSEGGSTATFNVVLDTQPTSGVTIGLSSSNVAEGTVTPSVSFTAGNWATPQAITVTGVNDAVVDGSIAYNIITAAAISADTAYNGINPDDVSATNIDNDNTTTGVVIVTPTAGLTTTEAGGTATFNVVLNIAPTANVTVPMSSTDTTEGTISIASLVFTAGNWSVPQLVTVTGVDDALNDGNVVYSIITSSTTSTDTKFNTINPPDITIVNNDNEFSTTAATSQIITVMADDAGASEGSADTGSFTITRAGRTANDLVVNYSVSGTASAGTDYTALAGSVVIPEGESSATVIIAALDDSSYEGDETVEIKITEGSYVISAPSSASVVIYDNETPPPAVNIGLDQTVEEGATVKVNVYLADSAPEYPVEIPYTVSGTATAGADHNATSGTMIIPSGTKGGITFATTSGGGSEADETVIITLGTPSSGARLGQRTSHTVTITEGNVAPSVSLSAKQSGAQTRLIVKAAELVTMTAAVTDANSGNTHGYSWSASNILVRESGTDDSFVFNPSDVPAGTYTVSVTVMDGKSSSSAALAIQVIDTAPVLGSTDSDGDGVNDNLEGFGDSDNDGIPNYQDASTLNSAELQGEAMNSDSNILAANPELNLTLGNTAFASADGDATLTSDQLPGDSVTNVGGYFDMTVTGLPQAGESVDIVIPQTDAIPANAVYRKYTATGWSDFVIDDNNAIASAQGTAGNCPAANDPAYTPGLIAGSHCVQLTIQDGGPNDADGSANYQVKNAGGVGSRAVTITISSGATGGGALNLFGLAALLMLLGMRIFRKVASDKIIH